MDQFEYLMPAKLVFGKGKAEEVGKYTAQFGKKALIVTGRSSAKKTGLLDRTINSLTKEGLSYVLFDKVEENPLTTTAEEGANMAISEGCDVVLGLGGGSVLDCAKAVAFIAINEGDISEYIFGKQGTGALPIIAVTTTAGTGSEGDSLAVLTNPITKDKKSLKSPFVYPKVSIIDPELMTTLPKHLIASTGFDALSHCIEAYIARRSNLFSEMYSLKGIALIAEFLPKVYENPSDVDSWEKVALANTLGGMAIDAAGVALGHGLEHSVSGLLNVRHGEGLAALYEVFLNYSCEVLPEKFAVIAKTLGEDIDGLNIAGAAKLSVVAVKKLMQKIGLNFTLGSLGVKEEHIEWLAANSMKTMIYAIGNNSRIPTIDEIKELYKACL